MSRTDPRPLPEPKLWNVWWLLAILSAAVCYDSLQNSLRALPQCRACSMISSHKVVGALVAVVVITVTGFAVHRRVERLIDALEEL